MSAVSRSVRLAASVALLVPVLASSVEAADDLGSSGVNASGTKSEPGWIVTIGGTVELAPTYEGADTPALRGVPSVSWRREGEAPSFAAPDDSLEYPLLAFQSWEIGPVLALGAGRSDGSNNSLVGLKSLPWTLETGAFVDYWPIAERLRLRAEVRHGLDGNSGWLADLGSDYVTRSGAFTFSVGPRLTIADGRQISRDFGITAAEAGANGHVAPFDPRAGITAFGGLISLGYEWSPSFTTVLYSKVEELVGPAHESPITQTFGDDDQWQAGVEFEYSFRAP